MRYTQLTEPQVKDMLATIGASSVESLFASVPEAIRCNGNLNVPAGVSELELLKDLNALAGKNKHCEELVSFLGGGAYDHFIPTVVDAMAGQSELLTAYTPYQAEASQGILQLFYEFQTMICQITGMDVANASLYEGATAAAEAMTMAANIKKRNRIIVAASVHPDTMAVLKSYAHERDLDVVVLPTPNGTVSASKLAAMMDDETAGVVVQSPNFFGCVERLDRIIPRIHEHGALAIVSVDPISCGLLKSPGDFDADIVVGEGQSLGIPLQYGGPYLGLMACRKEYLRKMPGRVVGMTHDEDGRRGFCLTLQTREQHIKRERATSNICTNQGLLAIRASIYMATMGKLGLEDVASRCFHKAHYAAEKIAALDGYSLRYGKSYFKEFVIQTTRDVAKVMASCRERGVLAGVALSRFDEDWSDCFLVAVTEKRTKQEIDLLVDALGAV